MYSIMIQNAARKAVLCPTESEVETFFYIYKRLIENMIMVIRQNGRITTEYMMNVQIFKYYSPYHSVAPLPFMANTFV